MNLLKRFKALFADAPVFAGLVVSKTEKHYTVNLLDGSGTMLCTPNPAYMVGDSVMVQGNTIVGTAQRVDTMLQFEV